MARPSRRDRCGAHHLGRVFAAQGQEVRLLSPEYVRPYVKAQKNDDLVAAAGNARAFRRGRDMAAWLGLTPAR
jgi:transposase